MIPNLDINDPIRKALQLKQLILMDGVDFDDIRKYANKQLVMSGVKAPETDEEKEMLQQAQQQQQPDPAMVLAQAEMLKGRADMLREQREGIKMQLEYQNDQAKTQIDAFEAQTKRMDTEIDAHEAGAKINETNIESFGKQLDNAAKIVELSDFRNMNNNELLDILRTG